MPVRGAGVKVSRLSPYCGRLSMGVIAVEEPTWIVPTTLNPCRSFPREALFIAQRKRVP